MSDYNDTTVKERPSSIFKDLGIMRARVEYNNDPWKIGRVKVRIPSIHGISGTSEFIPTEDLPWATPCVVGGCGEDFGQFIAPVPGTFVWVMFEDNDTNKPVYLGGIPSKGGELSKQMNNLTEEDSPLQKWQTEPGVAETPSDVFKGKSTGVPERHVIYKSQKGHTIIFDDTDGEESLSIIDRLGQTVKFKCPVSVSDNEGGYRRKDASSLEDNQLSKGQNPSILIRTGETSEKHYHNQLEIFQDSYSSECVNSDENKKTITQTTPHSYLQQTKDSTLEMLEDSIRLEYPGIKMFMCDDSFTIEAFNCCTLKMTKEGIDLSYGDNGLFIDSKSISLKHGTSILTEGDNITLESSGNTYIKGKEVHLN